MRIFFAFLIILFLILSSGCVGEMLGIAPAQNEKEEKIRCFPIPTSAVSIDGHCRDFETNCVPDGWTIVDSCKGYNQVNEEESPDESVLENLINENLCDDIECNDYCRGYALYSEGKCIQGNCLYSSVEDPSILCGFEKVPELETEFINCFYNPQAKKYQFFFTNKVVGEIDAQRDAVIWIEAHNPENNSFSKSYRNLSYRYVPGDFLFKELKWENKLQGNYWSLPDFNFFHSDLNYSLFYCPFYENRPCTKEYRYVLHEDTTALCSPA